MSIMSDNIKSVIKEYLQEEGILQEDIASNDFDFGYIFLFPPGGQKSQNMSIYKPKKRNDVFITIRFQISKERAIALNSLKRDHTIKAFEEVRRYFLIKEVNYKIDIQKMIIEIHEHFYPQQDTVISKDAMFEKIQKVFYCYIYSNLILEEYCKKKDSRSYENEYHLFS